METILSAAVCGVIYALFSGQPLTIIGATGPLLIFESTLYHICRYVSYIAEENCDLFKLMSYAELFCAFEERFKYHFFSSMV